MFTKDKKGFFFYPSGRKEETYTISESVERIVSVSAFDTCSYIKHIILPTTLTSVYRYLCYNTENLEDVTILRCIGDDSTLIVDGKMFIVFDSSNVKVEYSQNPFTYSLIGGRLFISPCKNCNASYCEFNSTIFQNDMRK